MHTHHLTHGTSGEATHPIEIPSLGIGVFRLGSKETRQTVSWALEEGYRHVDTAAIYGNEAYVGTAIGESDIQREALHVTTKLWQDAESTQDVVDGCRRSLDALQLEYVDLYLVHAPVSPKARRDVWRGMEKVLRAGQVRAIGVSNHGVHHLEELFSYAEIRPCVNQLELHPYLQRKDLVDFCQSHNIALTAYSPLTKGHKLDDPALLEIAQQVNKTPAQVLLRWGLQRDFIVIPKSARRERIEENAAIFDFELTDAHMATMAQWDEGLTTGWDPTTGP